VKQPLYVAFVWHMHQPYYRRDHSRELILPWVRLHAIKDYLHMAEILDQYPDVHATFNFVPSLIEQLLLYVSHEVTDKCLRISLKKKWTREDKEFMLAFFFSINREKVLRRYPPYWRLLEIHDCVQGSTEYLSERYYRDLATWFNLAWIDPNWLERNSVLRGLLNKGEGFSWDDTHAVIEIQYEMMARIMDLYRALENKGQIEITISPYFHPILPLIADSSCALEASPHLSLPERPFAYPEDAAVQIRQAMDFYEALFGRRPKGLWPSEGGVSQQILPLIREEGIRWIGSDEDVLAESLHVRIERDGHGHVTNPQVLYRPYRTQIPSEKGDVTSEGPIIIFRDHLLSDRIGFVYKSMDGCQAAKDLVSRLQHIHEAWDLTDCPPLVSIILDGENCWGEYEQNGDPFLHSLYELLSNEPNLRTVTVSEYLEQYPPEETLPRLFAGSWIGHNFETWIGEEAQNRAWNQLNKTREDLVAWQREHPKADPSLLEDAWRDIYVAEGSDWFWWYSSRNISPEDELFDQMFRQRLAHVYILIGQSVPMDLLVPNQKQKQEGRGRPISGYVTPTLEASAPASPRWDDAGLVVPETSSGTMQRVDFLIRRFYFGYDPAYLYLRLEVNGDLSEYSVHIFLSIRGRDLPTAYPELEAGQLPNLKTFQFEAVVAASTPQPILRQVSSQHTWETMTTSLTHEQQPKSSLYNGTCEIRIPFEPLGCRLGNGLDLWPVLSKENVVVDALPPDGPMSLELIPRGKR